jgi:DNA-binding LacI/PurR family transcriptional regulator
MVTITDVANAAHVSKKTVSRVINNHPDVAEATRAHVQRVIDQLGYRPSMLARGLARGKANIVGVIIDETAQDVFSYPLYSETLRGIASVLDANDLDMLVHFSRDETSYVDLYLQRRVDGLILLSMPMNDQRLQALLDSDAPCVLTQRASEQGAPLAWVDADFEGGARAAAQHLVELGHRRMAFVISPTTKAYVHFLLRGYHTVLDHHHLAVPDDLIATSEPYVSVSEDVIAAMIHRPDPPTAFACSDDMKAIQLIQLLQGLGYAVPGDMSVIGCDDALIARFASPPLTTIRQDAYHRGHLAAEVLVSRLNAGQNDQQAQMLLPTQLIVRGSTAPVPSN